MKEEKKKQLEKEIEEDRLLHIKLKEEEIEQKKKDNIIQIENFRKQIKEMQEEERTKYLERRKKEKIVSDYQKYQADQKRKIALTDFNEDQSNAYKNKYLLHKEQDDFINFAEEQIKKYDKEGKEIYPMMKQLMKYKKECV